MGTPGYSPPEAIREGRYTPQADVFAWGAVLYEVLSGRIPYEGPDTKTTNSFVVKGDAPSPAHYDSSIPEPLADVTMRALSPGSGNRMRDGADAEAALKEAWERCLKEGLVSPMAFAGEELPHEKVGATMHGGVTNPKAASQGWGPASQVTKIERPPASPAQAAAQVARTVEPPGTDAPHEDDEDPGQTTARREPPPKGPPTLPAGKAKAGKAASHGPFVIETRGKERIGDDDPTRILVREREEPRTERDPSASAPQEARPAKSEPKAAAKPASKPAGKAARDSSEVTGPGDGAPAWLVAVILVVVLAGGGVALWWFNYR
jgi:serine/threonine-protein kinase